MSHRIIRGLISAHRVAPPKVFSAVRRRPRGAKGAGVKFEREVAKAMLKATPFAISGQWFEFWDSAGRGLCQTDLIVVLPHVVYCFEVKLGNIPLGRTQFRALYKPVLERVYARPVQGIVIARHVGEDPEPALVTSDLEFALFASARRIPTLQFRERMPLHWPTTAASPHSSVLAHA